ncbi:MULTISPECIES: DUF1318 domain-containing protein [Lysobacteraceae]|nr:MULTISPECIES: DUF1318 domain-containing protein [Lysobacter]
MRNRRSKAGFLGGSLASMGALAALSACVTINVYFPAAEAKEAAKQFVEKVIGDDAATQPAKPATPGGGMAALIRRIDPLSLVGIGSAQAQETPDISIKAPAIQAIQARMESRFDASLRKGFDAGALGYSNDGLVVLRDPAQLELKDRVGMQSAVNDDNRDRKALYREMAVANGHPDWEGKLRAIFAKQWVDSAHGGWWYQDAGGAWKQK